MPLSPHGLSLSNSPLFASNGDLVSEILALGSPPLCIDRWIDNLCTEKEDGLCDPRAQQCPELKTSIKQLLFKLLHDRFAGSEQEGDRAFSDSASPRKRRREADRPMSEILMMMRGVAKDPCCPKVPGAIRDWKQEILKARKALFVRMENVCNMEEFPYRKKKETVGGKSSSTTYLSQGKMGSQETLQTTRRSRRTFSLLKLSDSGLPRKRIPIGEFFQVDVPEWTGPPPKRNAKDDSRWLGTRTWPTKGHNRETSERVIGKGRPDLCTCSSAGSVDCIRSHISTSRMHLKSELGRAFFSWGFDRMGEDVSKSWTHEDQVMFDDLVRLNPPSLDRSFWKPALEYFTSKSSRDIASYYFNVYLLRKARSSSGAVESDDDDDGDNGKTLQASTPSRYSQSFCYLPASVSYTMPRCPRM